MEFKNVGWVPESVEGILYVEITLPEAAVDELGVKAMPYSQFSQIVDAELKKT